MADIIKHPGLYFLFFSGSVLRFENVIGWHYRNIMLALRTLLGCVFTFRNANQRSLQALFIIKGINSMCVFPPLAHFQMVVSHWGRKRGFEDKRNHTTGLPDISLSLNNPSLLSTILFYLSVRGWHKFYVPADGFHFPFPRYLPMPSLFRLCPISHPSRQSRSSPLCHPVT